MPVFCIKGRFGRATQERPAGCFVLANTDCASGDKSARGGRFAPEFRRRVFKAPPMIRAWLEQHEEISMNHYEPSIPRLALGIAAVAMTAITIGASVIVPAQMDSGSRGLSMLVAPKVLAPASDRLATGTNVEVVAAPETGSSTVACDPAKPQP